VSATGLAQNRVDRTRRRAERVLDDERLRIFLENFFSFDAILRDERLWKGILNLAQSSRAKLRSRSNPHRFASWTENADAGFD